MSPTLTGLLAAVMWSCAAIFVAMAGRLPVFELMAVTWGIGLFAISIHNLLTGVPVLGVWNRPVRDYLFVLAGLAGNTVLYYMAFRHAPPFEANTLNYIWPILLIAFIDLTDKKRPNIRQLCGMALGFAGCVLILSGGRLVSFENFGIGHLYAIACAVVWAGYSALARGRGYPPGFMVPIYCLSTLIFAAVHWGSEQWVAPGPLEWLAIVVIGLIDTAYVLWDRAIRFGDRVLLTSVSYFIPLFSAVFLVLFGFGPASPVIAMAAVLIIAGCLVVNWPQILRVLRR